MEQQQYIWMVWAESASHTTHSGALNSYKEAQAKQREMKQSLYGKYKFHIERYPVTK